MILSTGSVVHETGWGQEAVLAAFEFLRCASVWGERRRTKASLLLPKPCWLVGRVESHSECVGEAIHTHPGPWCDERSSSPHYWKEMEGHLPRSFTAWNRQYLSALGKTWPISPLASIQRGQEWLPLEQGQEGYRRLKGQSSLLLPETPLYNRLFQFCSEQTAHPKAGHIWLTHCAKAVLQLRVSCERTNSEASGVQKTLH